MDRERPFTHVHAPPRIALFNQHYRTDDDISKPVKLEELGRMLQKTLSALARDGKQITGGTLDPFPGTDRDELPVHEGPRQQLLHASASCGARPTRRLLTPP